MEQNIERKKPGKYRKKVNKEICRVGYQKWVDRRWETRYLVCVALTLKVKEKLLSNDDLDLETAVSIVSEVAKRQIPAMTDGASSCTLTPTSVGAVRRSGKIKGYHDNQNKSLRTGVRGQE